MNRSIIEQISKDLNIKEKQVEVVLQLLSDGDLEICQYQKRAKS